MPSSHSPSTADVSGSFLLAAEAMDEEEAEERPAGERSQAGGSGAGSAGEGESSSGSGGGSGHGSDCAPMDAAVAAFEQHGVTHIDGVPTLTVPLATFSGRQNDETFAKEVCFLHDDVSCDRGDCGGCVGTASGRLCTATAERSIVNVVCPHPSLPSLPSPALTTT